MTKTAHCFFLAAFVLLPLLGGAQVPNLINYQARIAQGTNLVNGPMSLVLRLVTGSSGGTLMYEDSNTVTVTDGFYQTFLGDNTTFGDLSAAVAATNIWLEVVVNGNVLSPRERLSSSAYALLADGVRTGSVTSAMLADGAVTAGKIANQAVGAVHVAPGALPADRLGTGTVTAAITFSNPSNHFSGSGAALRDVPLGSLDARGLVEWGQFRRSYSNFAGNGFSDVKLADFDGDGDLDVAGVSFLAPFLLMLANDGYGHFTLAWSNSVIDGPFQMTIGDFNGDGWTDIATVNTSSTVTVFTNRQGLALHAATNFLVSGVGRVQTATLNGDAAQDLVVFASGTGHDTFSYTNNGTLGFALATSRMVRALTSQFIRDAVCKDFNADGRDDLAVVRSDGQTIILTNNGSGGFDNVDTMTATEVMALDYNGDGRMDLAGIGSEFPFGSGLLIHTNDGTGRFSFGYITNMTFFAPQFVADADGDGIEDIVGVEGTDRCVVMRRHGMQYDVTFDAEILFGDNADLQPGDLNGDGRVDFVDATRISSSSPAVHMYLNVPRYVGAFAGSGTELSDITGASIAPFSITNHHLTFGSVDGSKIVAGTIYGDLLAPGTVPVALSLTNTNNVVVGSLAGSFVGNGAGVSNVDLRVSVTHDAILWRTNYGHFAAVRTPPLTMSPELLAAGDVTADGRIDLMMVRDFFPDSAVVENRKGLVFQEHVGFAPGPSPTVIRMADFNGDGGLDVVVGSFDGDTPAFRVSTNNTAVTNALSFSEAIQSNVPAAVGSGLAVGDLNGDGRADILSRGLIFTNNGKARFTGAFTAPLGDAYEIADINGDASPDIVLLGTGSQFFEPFAYTNRGTGSFAAVTGGFPSNMFARDIALADFDGDGDPDVVYADVFTNALVVLTNNGRGIFTYGDSMPVAADPTGVIAADINKDGKPDVIGFNQSDNLVSIFTNRGQAKFASHAILPVAGHTLDIIAADFDGDGALDLAKTSASSNTVELLINQPQYEANFTGYGNGLREISGTNIVAGTITGAQLATGAITTAHLATGAVSTTSIAAEAVTSDKLLVGWGATMRLTGFVTNPVDSFQARSNLFGAAIVSAGPDRLAVGAPRDGIDHGRVFLYTGAGMPLTNFADPSPSLGAMFGTTLVSLNTNGFLVGSYQKETAHQYDRNGAIDRVYNDPDFGSDQFGVGLAVLDTNRLAIGAPLEDKGATNSGTVRVFNQIDLFAETVVTNPARMTEDRFGAVLAPLGTGGFAAGAPGSDAGSTNAGRVYLFDSNALLLATIDNPTPQADDQFGSVLERIGTDRLAVGVPDDDAGGLDAGVVHLYDRTGQLLLTLASPSPAAGDRFGAAIEELSPGLLMIGAPGADVGGPDAGAAYLFDVFGTLITTVTNPTPAAGDAFGCSLALIGSNRFAIGASADDTASIDAGSVYFYDLAIFTHAVGLVAEGVRVGGISNAMLSANAVTGDKIAAGSLSNVHLAAGIVTGDKMAVGTISNANIATEVLTNIAARLASNVWAVADATTNYVRRTGDVMTGPLSVTAGGLSVTGPVSIAGIISGNGAGLTNISDGALSTNVTRLGGGIEGGEIVAGTLSNSHLSASAGITGDRIADGTISNADMATGAVFGTRIATGAISNSHLAANAVNSAKIADGSVASLDLATNIGVWALAGTNITYTNGNAGIGTASPDAPLHVARNSSGVNAFSASIAVLESGGAGYLNFLNAGTNSPAGLIFGNGASVTDAAIIYNSLTGLRGLFFYLDGVGLAPDITFSSAGQIGVGTSDPETEVHIQRAPAGTITANSSALLALENSTNAFIHFLVPTNAMSGLLFGNPGDPLESSIRLNNNGGQEMTIRVGGNSTRMTILTNGNVGIGTTSPTNRLQVAGIVQATAYLTTSDRNAKKDIHPVFVDEILRRVAALPIATWQFKEEANGIHIGPMAQDFHAAFGFGNTDTGIMTVDADGVALAAIQALKKQMDEKDRRIEALERQNDELARRLDEILRRLEADRGH